MTVWEPGKQPLPAKPRRKMGRPPRLLQRSTDHQPVSVKQLAMSLPSTAFQAITWRQGTDRKLRSRFAAVRVRAAHRDYEKAEPHPEEWLLIEWPRGEAEPSKYWLSTLPLNTKLKALTKMAKHRWIIERDYEKLKQELGLGHFEGRNWRGFHHHATLCIAAYGFLVAERNRFSPSARAGHLEFAALGPVPDVIDDPAIVMLWGITRESLDTWLNADSDATTNELRGFAASSGVVEGPARVVKSVEEIARLRKGDILVCQVTNPTWAPVFQKIAGAVSDIGGSMSHAAIVAREYGLPAVVGTGTATSRIRDGQRIRVDGGRGVVTILQ